MTDSRHTDPPPLDLLTGLHETLAREQTGWRRVRSWSSPQRRLALLGLLFALALLVLVATPRLDMAAVPWTRLLLGLGLTVLGAAYAADAFLRPLHKRQPGATRAAVTAVALLLLPLAFALLPPAHAAEHVHPESFAGTGAEFVPRAIGCLIFGTLVGAPLVAFLGLADRRAPARPGRIALAAGAGGAAGTLALMLHCPLVGHAHRLAGHAGVALLLAVLFGGALLAIQCVGLRKTRSDP